jgi:hypothetical protein
MRPTPAHGAAAELRRIRMLDAFPDGCTMSDVDALCGTSAYRCTMNAQQFKDTILDAREPADPYVSTARCQWTRNVAATSQLRGGRLSNQSAQLVASIRYVTCARPLDTVTYTALSYMDNWQPYDALRAPYTCGTTVSRHPCARLRKTRRRITVIPATSRTCRYVTN